jgi:hypothetical protein
MGLKFSHHFSRKWTGLYTKLNLLRAYKHRIDISGPCYATSALPNTQKEYHNVTER